MLTSGPHAFHPMLVMQQQGILREHGYAFSPMKELGKFGGDPTLAKPDFSLASDSLKNQVSGDAHEDKSIAFRYFGVNSLQRRQIKMCLSDIDRHDYNITFHVLASYPYTDWLHAFYVLSFGLFLYDMQKRYRMYDFYDEYLGLDLRQVRSLEKPVLLAVTFIVMFTVLMQPMMLITIASTRIYRILMGRPIGPP
jgi:hypothetical protein